MSDRQHFDDKAAKRVEALYSTSDVIAQRQQVIQALAPRVGERILDIGSGPGFLALDMAHAVGSSGRVTGIDISESMLAIAQDRCADQPWIEFRKVDATHLPFEDNEFDAAAVTQVYEYVADIGSALAELSPYTRRVGPTSGRPSAAKNAPPQVAAIRLYADPQFGDADVQPGL